VISKASEVVGAIYYMASAYGHVIVNAVIKTAASL